MNTMKTKIQIGNKVRSKVIRKDDVGTVKEIGTSNHALPIAVVYDDDASIEYDHREDELEVVESVFVCEDKACPRFGKPLNKEFVCEEAEFVPFGVKHKGKKLKDCLSSEEIDCILDVERYSFYTPEDLNKIVGVDIEGEEQ